MAVLHGNEEAFPRSWRAANPCWWTFSPPGAVPARCWPPVIEELAADYEGRLHVLKLDTDENQSLAMNYGIMNIPTVVLFQGGNEVDRLVGVLPKESFAQMIDAHL